MENCKFYLYIVFTDFIFPFLDKYKVGSKSSRTIFKVYIYTSGYQFFWSTGLDYSHIFSANALEKSFFETVCIASITVALTSVSFQNLCPLNRFLVLGRSKHHKTWGEENMIDVVKQSQCLSRYWIIIWVRYVETLSCSNFLPFLWNSGLFILVASLKW